MKIGLIRHFKVNCTKKVFMNSQDLVDYAKAYDTSEIIENKIDLYHNQWDKCYCSDLYRAIKTSEVAYDGQGVQDPLIREVTIDPVIHCPIKLPYLFWSISSRVQWYFNIGRSQRELRKHTEKRAADFLDKLEKGDETNVLVVSHALFLHIFQKELLKRGYIGTLVVAPKNGVLYVYDK